MWKDIIEKDKSFGYDSKTGVIFMRNMTDNRWSEPFLYPSIGYAGESCPLCEAIAS